ncbi:hypothetical protein C8Q80DRAFT_1124120 [Daedaleopsis nitida]|nr:hypothetical protein C8Q80DRAFT_1124120 [Daedaleopsis nitida]
MAMEDAQESRARIAATSILIYSADRDNCPSRRRCISLGGHSSESMPCETTSWHQRCRASRPVNCMSQPMFNELNNLANWRGLRRCSRESILPHGSDDVNGMPPVWLPQGCQDVDCGTRGAFARPPGLALLSIVMSELVESVWPGEHVDARPVVEHCGGWVVAKGLVWRRSRSASSCARNRRFGGRRGYSEVVVHDCAPSGPFFMIAGEGLTKNRGRREGQRRQSSFVENCEAAQPGVQRLVFSRSCAEDRGRIVAPGGVDRETVSYDDAGRRRVGKNGLEAVAEEVEPYRGAQFYFPGRRLKKAALSRFGMKGAVMRSEGREVEGAIVPSNRGPLFVTRRGRLAMAAASIAVRHTGRPSPLWGDGSWYWAGDTSRPAPPLWYQKLWRLGKVGVVRRHVSPTNVNAKSGKASHTRNQLMLGVINIICRELLAPERHVQLELLLRPRHTLTLHDLLEFSRSPSPTRRSPRREALFSRVVADGGSTGVGDRCGERGFGEVVDAFGHEFERQGGVGALAELVKRDVRLVHLFVSAIKKSFVESVGRRKPQWRKMVMEVVKEGFGAAVGAPLSAAVGVEPAAPRQPLTRLLSTPTTGSPDCRWIANSPGARHEDPLRASRSHFGDVHGYRAAAEGNGPGHELYLMARIPFHGVRESCSDRLQGDFVVHNLSRLSCFKAHHSLTIWQTNASSKHALAQVWKACRTTFDYLPLAVARVDARFQAYIPRVQIIDGETLGAHGGPYPDTRTWTRSAYHRERKGSRTKCDRGCQPAQRWTAYWSQRNTKTSTLTIRDDGERSFTVYDAAPENKRDKGMQNTRTRSILGLEAQELTAIDASRKSQVDIHASRVRAVEEPQLWEWVALPAPEVEVENIERRRREIPPRPASIQCTGRSQSAGTERGGGTWKVRASVRRGTILWVNCSGRYALHAQGIEKPTFYGKCKIRVRTLPYALSAAAVSHDPVPRSRGVQIVVKPETKNVIMTCSRTKQTGGEVVSMELSANESLSEVASEVGEIRRRCHILSSPGQRTPKVEYRQREDWTEENLNWGFQRADSRIRAPVRECLARQPEDNNNDEDLGNDLTMDMHRVDRHTCPFPEKCTARVRGHRPICERSMRLSYADRPSLKPMNACYNAGYGVACAISPSIVTSTHAVVHLAMDRLDIIPALGFGDAEEETPDPYAAVADAPGFKADVLTVLWVLSLIVSERDRVDVVEVQERGYCYRSYGQLQLESVRWGTGNSARGSQ